ncbi:MAG: carboxypeptidase M32 [Thermoplasmatales archaeon]|nr:carboxypeptidase M32 [Thermoplasmatales archaeon]
MSVYDEFIGYVKELYDLRKASDLLEWDQETYMPSGSVEGRGYVLATLSGIYHEKLTSKKMEKYLKKLEIEKDLTDEQKANAREIKRIYEKKTKVPLKLVKEIAKTSSLGTEAWARARKKSDFKIFQPYLEKMVSLKKDFAETIGYEDKAYDVLIDDFEPYTAIKDIEPVFSGLRKKLVPIVKKITESETKIDDILNQSFDVDKQKKFGIEIIKDMGFDFEHGRLDSSAHPFTSGSCDDVRLTTFKEGQGFHLFAMMHEAGHGLYEQGYKKEHYRTPMAEAISLGYHESQSRMWENLIGRSRIFWEYHYPKLQNIFPEQLKKYGLEEFYRAINIVKPSFIRVDADETTYNLHILLRYDMEKNLFDDRIDAKETPEVWSQKMEEYLGIVPENDSAGVLQDIHWSQGLFGYFPTYTLGNLYSVQLFNQAKKDMPNLDEKISNGHLLDLKKWLNKNVHEYGKLYSAKELTKKITGETLNPEHFIKYLKEKFGLIYGVTF